METAATHREDNHELFWRIVDKIGASTVRNEYGDNPQCDMDCPECAHDSRHFGFSPKGANCFSCQYRTSLYGLSIRLGINTNTPYTPQVREIKPSVPTHWQRNPQAYLDRFTSHPQTLAKWAKYKPLSVDTMIRHNFGLGILPSSKCKHQRLIVPIYENSAIVGFRGRAISCDCPKWLTAKGSKTTLYGVESVNPGDTVMWVENHVDALMVNERLSPMKAVASTAGAGSWRGLVDMLIARKPGVVVIALDNDLAGIPNEETYMILAKEFREKTGREPNKPSASGLLAAMMKAGIVCSIWKWPQGTPPKCDMGSYLTNAI